MASNIKNIIVTINYAIVNSHYKVYIYTIKKFVFKQYIYIRKQKT